MYNNGVTDGVAKVRTSTPGKLNVKTGHPEFTSYSGIQYSFGFQQFFCDFQTVLVQKSTCRRIFIFQLFSECWLMGLFQLRFPPWLKPLVTPLIYSLIFLNNFFLDYTTDSYSQRGFSNVMCTTASLSRQMLTTKLSRMPLRNGCQTLIPGSYGSWEDQFL